LDGVLTDTAALHELAWTQLFGSVLGNERAFDHADYLNLVDGRSRLDGLAAVLVDRGIELAVGDPGDAATAMTHHGLATRKQRDFMALLDEQGIRPFPDATSCLRWCRQQSLTVAVVSASRSLDRVLEASGLAPMVDCRIGGVEAAAAGLAGKPAPDAFLEASRQLGVAPKDSAVCEDAPAGVTAARAGRYGLVVGIDRTGDRSRQLIDAGADVVVPDLAQLRHHVEV
jgi:beta-phosphoglucomutase-like phosphatase (HAD superfamily)